jgi:predicted ATPase/DNA-binding CsgD family transcriptional regulator
MALAVSVSPAPSTPLHGRTAELETVVQRLSAEHVRLVTLTGPAGAGKTRLALAAGERLVPAFPDGVVFVDLTVVRDPSLVLATIAQQLGLVDTGSRSLSDLLQEYVADRALLLILDNFEHVLPAAGALPPLLAAGSRTRMLVTSRIPLRLRSEQTIRLFPLPVPEADQMVGLDDVVQVPSVALLVERVRAHRADYVTTAQQAPVLIALTRQLDGLPLAIELAAAQAQALSLAAIARRLERHAQSLRWDAYDLPERHRSLEAALGWSYQLLTGEEQRLFRHLGVFVGRVTPDAVAAVLGEIDEDEVLDRLIVLAEQSLVVPAGTDEDTEPTFRMLETVRQYAHEQLEAEGELGTAARRHAGYYLALAERADPELRGRDQLTWRRRLDAEQDNLRAALRWLLDTEEFEQAVQLAGALGHYWWLRGYFTEGARWLEETLLRAPDAEPGIRTRALLQGARLLAGRVDLRPSNALLYEAHALAEARADGLAIALSSLFLGASSTGAGDVIEGKRLLHHALALWEEIGDDYYSSYTLTSLASVSFVQGEYQKATELYAAGIERWQRIGELAELSQLPLGAALPQIRLGDHAAAVQLVQEGLRRGRSHQDRWVVSLGAEVTLLLLGTSGDVERRARLLGARDVLAQVTGFKPGTLEAPSGLSLDELRTQLEREQIQRAYQAGRALNLEAAVALALELLEEYARTLGGDTRETEPVTASPLSAREQEVLRLVAEGMTSKRIGQQLFLSPRTIDHHLTSIFNKLGVETRAQAVAVSSRAGIL